MDAGGGREAAYPVLRLGAAFFIVSRPLTVPAQIQYLSPDSHPGSRLLLLQVIGEVSLELGTGGRYGETSSPRHTHPARDTSASPPCSLLSGRISTLKDETGAVGVERELKRGGW